MNPYESSGLVLWRDMIAFKWWTDLIYAFIYI